MSEVLSLNPNLKQNAKKDIKIENNAAVINTKPINNASFNNTPAVNAESMQSDSNQSIESIDSQAQESINQTTESNSNLDSSTNITQDSIPIDSQAKESMQTNIADSENSLINSDSNPAENKKELSKKDEYDALDSNFKAFLEQTYKAKQSYERLQNNSFSRITGAAFSNAVDKSGKGFPVFNEIRATIDGAQVESDAIEHDKTQLYDYIAKYGNTAGFKNLDKNEIKAAESRRRIAKAKDLDQLSDADKDYLLESDTILGRVWDNITGKSTSARLEDNRRALERRQLDANLVNDLVKLDNTTEYSNILTSIFDNDDEKKELRDRFLTEGTKIAQKYGYDNLAIDKKSKKVVVIKDGKAYTPDIEGFFRNFDKTLVNNFYDIALTIGTGGAGIAKTGVTKIGGKLLSKQLAKQAAQNSTKASLTHAAAGAAAGSLIASPLDYIAQRNDIGEDAHLKEALKYGAANAAAGAVGTYAIGGAIKGVQKAINVRDAIKNINLDDLKDAKINNIFSNEDMAIDRKLAKFDKKELDKSYENFKALQGKDSIAKDIKETGLIADFMDKINSYNPINRFTSKAEKQDRLMAAIFSNKELASEFSGKLTGEEATYIQKGIARLGENFSKLSKDYEEQMLKEYIASGKTHVDNIPALYRDLLQNIDKEIKLDYEKRIKDLNDILQGEDFKGQIYSAYKSITNESIASLGTDNELSKALIRETSIIESKPKIDLKDAIEFRKTINDLIRSYNKRGTDLKKFRNTTRLDSLKKDIDNAISTKLESRVKEGSLLKNTADDLLNNFHKANEKYAEVKTLLSDKFAKAITKGASKKDLNSQLTIEQWKRKVLDTDWGDSIKGLENTIFKNFNPKMQENTQVLLILRALDRNINMGSDTNPIDMKKILNDLEKLEDLTLAPKVYPILDLFKSYAKAYSFALDIAKPKSLETMHGGGAMATSLSGRIQVFMTNRLFKKLFAFVPLLGDNNALLKSLSKAVQNLKYPSEITLETLKQLEKADIERGFKPLKKPEFDTKITINESNAPGIISKADAIKPYSESELKDLVKNGNKDRYVKQETLDELSDIATDPSLLNPAHAHKYDSNIYENKATFNELKDSIKNEISNGRIIAESNLRSDKELLNKAQSLVDSEAIESITPNNIFFKEFTHNDSSYRVALDQNFVPFLIKNNAKKDPIIDYDSYKSIYARDNNEFLEIRNIYENTLHDRNKYFNDDDAIGPFIQTSFNNKTSSDSLRKSLDSYENSHAIDSTNESKKKDKTRKQKWQERLLRKREKKEAIRESISESEGS